MPFLETVRRDNCPSWKAYFDFDRSYARYVQYLIARYGAYNLIFSGIHLDWIPKEYSLTADEFNAALTHHWKTYGALAVRAAVHDADRQLDLPALRPRRAGAVADDAHRRQQAAQQRDLRVARGAVPPRPALPAANLEPYYAGWNHEINRPGGETPAADSERDRYFARSMMYGSVLSGGLAGHVYGTGAYDVTSTGEPPGWRPVHLGGAALRVGRADAAPGPLRALARATATSSSSSRRSTSTPRRSAGLLGRRPRRLELHDAHGRPPPRAALLRGEGRAAARRGPRAANARYAWSWYDPRRGQWHAPPSRCAAMRRARRGRPRSRTADRSRRSTGRRGSRRWRRGERPGRPARPAGGPTAGEAAFRRSGRARRVDGSRAVPGLCRRPVVDRPPPAASDGGGGRARDRGADDRANVADARHAALRAGARRALDGAPSRAARDRAQRLSPPAARDRRRGAAEGAGRPREGAPRTDGA